MDSTPNYQTLPLIRDQNPVAPTTAHPPRLSFAFPSAKQLIALAFVVTMTAFFSAYWTRTSFVSKMLGHNSIHSSNVRFRSRSDISRFSRRSPKLLNSKLDPRRLRTFGFDMAEICAELVKHRFCSTCARMGYSVRPYVLNITELCTILSEGHYCKVCKSLGYEEPA